MCNCPLTSLNKVLISVFSRSLWLKWSFNYWRTAREGKGADGEEVEQWTFKKKKNFWTWVSCHNVDLNLGALQSFSNLVMCVHIDKFWNRLPQTLEKRSVFSRWFQNFQRLFWVERWFCPTRPYPGPWVICPVFAPSGSSHLPFVTPAWLVTFITSGQSCKYDQKL